MELTCVKRERFSFRLPSVGRGVKTEIQLTAFRTLNIRLPFHFLGPIFFAPSAKSLLQIYNVVHVFFTYFSASCHPGNRASRPILIPPPRTLPTPSLPGSRPLSSPIIVYDGTEGGNHKVALYLLSSPFVTRGCIMRLFIIY